MSPTTVVTFGGPSPEHDISILTGLQCERLLRSAGADVKSVYWSRSGEWFLVPADTEARDYVDGPPRQSAPAELRLGAAPGWYVKRGLRTAPIDVDVVLNCFHGGFGENGGAQSLFEMMGLPFTGSPRSASALGMDKYAFTTVIDSVGLPHLPRELLEEGIKPSFDGPYIVKPRFGGSSIGIVVVDNLDAALAIRSTSPHLRDGAVVEPYRPDLYDLNIGVRNHPEFATSLIERPLRGGSTEIYSYAEKYLQGAGLESSPRELPAALPDGVAEEIQDAARRVCEAVGVAGVARIDFLSDGEKVYVNEINTIPGAMALYLWAEDTDAAEVLRSMLTEAMERRTAGVSASSDGSALLAAGGISGKLARLQAGPGSS
jgi:D-alanine-D-alanine ligase